MADMLINKNNVFYRKWYCKKPVAVILAIHGMGAHSERYRDMAKFLNSKKISTYQFPCAVMVNFLKKNAIV